MLEKSKGEDKALTDGIICIDKPMDFTSFDVVAKARGITRIRKMGHGGTLDPMATGVLPLFVGRATKAMDIMPIQDKRYTAGFKLGIVTDTQDVTGKILEEKNFSVSEQAILELLPRFRGEIEQLPPMYSAVWVNGQRLYDLARQGREVERPTRSVTVHRLELLCYNETTGEGMLDIACSKGTYVRTIIHDLGEVLGCGATLSSLRRTETMGYTLEDCITLEQLQQHRNDNTLEQLILPIESAFRVYPRLELSDKHTKLFLNGVRLSAEQLGFPKKDTIYTIWNNGEFLATAGIDEQKNVLIAEKLFKTLNK